MVLYMPCAQQQSFYSTVFSRFRFQYNGLLFIFAISKGKSFFTRHVAGNNTHRVYIRSVYFGSQAVERS